MPRNRNNGRTRGGVPTGSIYTISINNSSESPPPPVRASENANVPSSQAVGLFSTEPLHVDYNAAMDRLVTAVATGEVSSAEDIAASTRVLNDIAQRAQRARQDLEESTESPARAPNYVNAVVTLGPNTTTTAAAGTVTYQLERPLTNQALTESPSVTRAREEARWMTELRRAVNVSSSRENDRGVFVPRPGGERIPSDEANVLRVGRRAIDATTESEPHWTAAQRSVLHDWEDENPSVQPIPMDPQAYSLVERLATRAGVDPGVFRLDPGVPVTVQLNEALEELERIEASESPGSTREAPVPPQVPPPIFRPEEIGQPQPVRGTTRQQAIRDARRLAGEDRRAAERAAMEAHASWDPEGRPIPARGAGRVPAAVGNVSSPSELEADRQLLAEIRTRCATNPFPDFRFGVEIEYIGISREEAHVVLTAAGISVAIEEYNHQRRNHWKLTTDSSIRVSRGMMPHFAGELVSPPLYGIEGLEQVIKVCRVMTANGARVNASCGLHVHVDGATLNAQDVAQILMRYSANQQYLDFFMSHDRRNNRYCLPVTAAMSDLDRWVAALWNEETPIGEVARRWNRYSTVNLASWTRHGTVEFRQHAGSVDPNVVANWIQFCLYFVATSRFVITSESVLAAATPSLRASTSSMVNGIRLNRRIRYDRRRAFFSYLIEQCRAGVVVTDQSAAHFLRTTKSVVHRMVEELNQIAMNNESLIRMVPGIEGNFYRNPARGFYISTMFGGGGRNKRYTLSHMLDIVRGYEQPTAWSLRSVFSPTLNAALVPEGQVAPFDWQTYHHLATWLGGMAPYVERFSFGNIPFIDQSFPGQNTTDTNSRNHARRFYQEGVELWDNNWATRLLLDGRSRMPRVPPVDNNLAPSSIPVRRRSTRALYVRPTMQSFQGLRSLFKDMPVVLREFYLGRASRNRAPWISEVSEIQSA